MKKHTLTIVLLSITVICLAQTKETKYYADEWLQKEVNEKKGKFSETITQNQDGSITRERKNIKKDEIIKRQCYKGEEPFGVWIFQRNNQKVEYDYSFEVNYVDEYCKDGIPNLKDYFSNNDELKYVAPTIEGGLTMLQFLSSNIEYPTEAKLKDIMGIVYISFTITEKGEVENIAVLRGAHILLDKEAVRVIRKLKFTSPPTINGQTKTLCISLPISFKLSR